MPDIQDALSYHGRRSVDEMLIALNAEAAPLLGYTGSSRRCTLLDSC